LTNALRTRITSREGIDRELWSGWGSNELNLTHNEGEKPSLKGEEGWFQQVHKASHPLSSREWNQDR
jgi:hypothetical protein